MGQGNKGFNAIESKNPPKSQTKIIGYINVQHESSPLLRVLSVYISFLNLRDRS